MCVGGPRFVLMSLHRVTPWPVARILSTRLMMYFRGHLPKDSLQKSTIVWFGVDRLCHFFLIFCGLLWTHQHCIVKICNASPGAKAHKLQRDPFTVYGLLTKCEVKMAGYWPTSFFGCLWTETEAKEREVHLARSGANHSAGFGSSCPLTELAI